MNETSPEDSSSDSLSLLKSVLYGLTGVSLLFPVLLFLVGGVSGGERGFGYMWGALFAVLPALGATPCLGVGGAIAGAAVDRKYGRLGRAVSTVGALVLAMTGVSIWWIWGTTQGAGFFT